MKKPPTLHGLRILSPADARQEGFASITTDILVEHEKPILASVCQHRNPDRACLISTSPTTYQLAIKREDVSGIAD